MKIKIIQTRQEKPFLYVPQKIETGNIKTET